MITRDDFAGSLGVSVASIGVLAIFAIATAPSLTKAVLSTSDDSHAVQRANELIASSSELRQHQTDLFNGRSLFFDPPPVRRTAPPVIVQEEPEEVEEPAPVVDRGPPPPPASYAGPELVAIHANEAWFKGSGDLMDPFLIARVGEVVEGIEVVALTVPWTAKVRHRGGEYDVALFSITSPLDAPPKDLSLDVPEGLTTSTPPGMPMTPRPPAPTNPTAPPASDDASDEVPDAPPSDADEDSTKDPKGSEKDKTPAPPKPPSGSGHGGPVPGGSPPPSGGSSPVPGGTPPPPKGDGSPVPGGTPPGGGKDPV
jgi:hypothetical protein